MKKAVLLSAVISVLMSLSAWSQSQSQSAEPSDVFVKTVPVVKVYTHTLGYKVLYLKSNMEMGVLYLPTAWLKQAGGKAAIIWQTADRPPHFSIFWVDGKFDHIYLYVPNNLSLPFWGTLDSSQDLSAEFNIDQPKLSF
jgi:hypothetical protein